MASHQNHLGPDAASSSSQRAFTLSPQIYLVPHACRIGHQLRESVGLLDNEGGDALYKGLLAVTR